MSLPQPRSGAAALVTGASAGIGAAIAAQLAARNHNLVLVARRKPRLDELARELRARHGVRVETVGSDLSKPASRARLPGRIESLNLEIDTLVNNAGFATGGPFHESDTDRELEQLRVLVEAPVHLTSLFAPQMVSRKNGAILNIASTAGMQPLPYSAGYSAAKAYMLTFSEALHYELKGRGITVTVLAPGPVDTDFWQIADWKVSTGQSFEQAVPRPTLITAEEAARAGVEGLEAGRRVVVPTLSMRVAMETSRYVPHALKLPVIERVMRRR